MAVIAISNFHMAGDGISNAFLEDWGVSDGISKYLEDWYCDFEYLFI